MLSAVRAMVLSKIFRILDSFVMARTNAILRDILPSVNDFMLPTGASLMLEFNLTAYNVLFRGRSRETKLKSLSPLLMAEGDSIPSGIAVIASHESELWYVLCIFEYTCHVHVVSQTTSQDKSGVYERYICDGSPG